MSAVATWHPRAVVSRAAERLTRVAVVLRRIVGAPDYERYLDHVRARHPDAVPLTRAEFERSVMEARARPGARCC